MLYATPRHNLVLATTAVRTMAYQAWRMAYGVWADVVTHSGFPGRWNLNPLVSTHARGQGATPRAPAASACALLYQVRSILFFHPIFIRAKRVSNWYIPKKKSTHRQPASCRGYDRCYANGAGSISWCCGSDYSYLAQLWLVVDSDSTLLLNPFSFFFDFFLFFFFLLKSVR